MVELVGGGSVINVAFFHAMARFDFPKHNKVHPGMFNLFRYLVFF